jgi:competence protein ComEC
VRGARKNDALCAEAKDKGPDASDNRNSVVLLLEHGPFRFFDGGDLTWQNEATLVCPLDRVGPVDVYQTNHHGLSSSNNPVLVRTLDPIVTVMNNGPRKGSHPETFVTLKALPRQQALYQVHRNVREGVGETNTEDAALIANRDESCKGESVYLSVAPDGRNYTVRVPSTGHERTYETRRAVAVAGGSSR